MRIVSPLLAPALIGSFAGVRILTSLDTRYIKLVAGLVVVSFAIMVARGFVIPGIRSRLAPIVAGFSSGALGSSTRMSGPPVVLFLPIAHGTARFPSQHHGLLHRHEPGRDRTRDSDRRGGQSRSSGSRSPCCHLPCLVGGWASICTTESIRPNSAASRSSCSS